MMLYDYYCCIMIEVVLYRSIMYASLDCYYTMITVYEYWLPWVYLTALVTLGSQNPIGYIDQQGRDWA